MKQSESLSKLDIQSLWKKVNRFTAIRKEVLDWVKWDKVMIKAAKSKWLYRRRTNLSPIQRGNLTMAMSLSPCLSLNLESQPIVVPQRVNRPQREKAKRLLQWVILRTSMRAKHQKATAGKSVISQQKDSQMMGWTRTSTHRRSRSKKKRLHLDLVEMSIPQLRISPSRHTEHLKRDRTKLSPAVNKSQRSRLLFLTTTTYHLPTWVQLTKRQI